jgi:hypothetical protein
MPSDFDYTASCASIRFAVECRKKWLGKATRDKEQKGVKGGQYRISNRDRRPVVLQAVFSSLIDSHLDTLLAFGALGGL